MTCITRDVYDTLSQYYDLSSNQLSRHCGRSKSYLRSLWARGAEPSLEAMFCLYCSLNDFAENAEEETEKGKITDVTDRVWSEMERQAANLLENAHAA